LTFGVPLGRKARKMAAVRVMTNAKGHEKAARKDGFSNRDSRG